MLRTNSEYGLQCLAFTFLKREKKDETKEAIQCSCLQIDTFAMVHCLIFGFLLFFRDDKTVPEGCRLGRSGLSDRRHAPRNI